MAYDLARKKHVSRDWSCGAADSDSPESRAEVDTIKRWHSALEVQAEKIRSKYADTHPLTKDLLADVDKSWHIASEFSKTAKTIHNISPEEIRRADYNAVDLLEIRSQLKQTPADSVVSDELRDKSVAAMTAPISWLSQAGTPVLQRQQMIQDLTRKAADAPSSTLHWFLDQLLKTLGLPSWFLPATATVVVVGLGVWAYRSFLAPVTSVTRRVTAT